MTQISTFFSCRKVKLFENSKITFWITGIVVVGCLWTCFSYNFLSCDTFSRSYLKTEFSEKFRMDTSSMNCMSLIVIDYSVPQEPQIRWLGAVYLSVLSVVLVSWVYVCSASSVSFQTLKLSVMLYCGFRMAARVNKRASFRSSKYQKQHAHFLKSLCLQVRLISFCYHPFLSAYHSDLYCLSTNHIHCLCTASKHSDKHPEWSSSGSFHKLPSYRWNHSTSRRF